VLPLISIGQHANGVIAIGQIATGVVAIGQIATGAIAIGQVARGVVAIGMASVGLVSIGIGSVGVVWCSGLVGVGVRAGFGWILPLAPRLDRGRRVPETLSLAAIRSGRQGWLSLRLQAAAEGVAAFHDGTAIALQFDSRLAYAARCFAQNRPTVLAEVKNSESGLLCSQLMYVPRRCYLQPRWWLTTISKMLLLFAISYGFWRLAATPVPRDVLTKLAP